MLKMSGEAPEGKYVYCISEGEASKDFGSIGVGGNRVYALSSQGITAVAHDCQPAPYDSRDLTEVGKWLAAHNRVIELAMHELGPVVPLRFNTIFKPSQGTTSTQTLEEWIIKENDALKGKLKRVAGKKEYGVQVYCGEEAISGKTPGLEGLKQKISASGPGTAYLYRQKLYRAVMKNAQETAASFSKEFYQAVKKCVSEISVLEKRSREGKLMLANLACLASEEQEEKLGWELERIRESGFEVRFTGPWPPYNFV